MLLILFFLECLCLGLENDNPFQYSGFIKVNETYDTNLYYCLFPSKDGNKNAPLILWLQGGPGVSSIGDGAFNENGPFHVTDDLKLIDNPYAWNTHFNMLYVDQPAGAGFSYTSKGGYVYWVDDSSAQLYIFLQKFFSMYPHLQGNDLYIAGESYGGKWVPGIAHAIKKNGMKMNLKGIMIGDGLVDTVNQIPMYSEMGKGYSLLDLNEQATMEAMQIQTIQYIEEKNWAAGYEGWHQIVDIYFKKVTGGINYYDIRKNGPYDWTNTVDYLNLPSTRELMHTENFVFNRSSSLVYDNFSPDVAKSVVDYISEALDDSNIKVLLYQGQFDWVCGTAGAERWISMMEWSGNEAYNRLSKSLWKGDEGKTIGYKKNYKNLYYSIVLDAGHLSPLDQPEHVLNLISGFINNKF